MKQDYLPLSSMVVANDAPVVDTWKQWTHVQVFVDGIALSVYSKMKSAEVKKALLALHVALKGVNKEFLTVITALEKPSPEIPPVPINPSPVPDWKDDPSIFDGILEIVKSALAEALVIISKYACDALQPVIHSVGALINCIDEVIEIFRKHKDDDE